MPPSGHPPPPALRPLPDRRSLVRLLALALLLPLVVLAASAAIAWRETARQAESDTLRTADSAAEYAGRLLDAQRQMLERLADLLGGRDDAAIRADEALLHTRLHSLVASLPPNQSSFVLDRNGTVLLAANLYPVPANLNFADREFYQVLARRAEPEVDVSRVYRARVDRTLYFAISRRRSAPDGSFNGVISLAIYPRDLAEGLRELRNEPADHIALVRTDGALLTTTRELDAPPPPIPDGVELRAAMTRGERRLSLELPAVENRPARLAALRQVQGWPVYALATRPHALVYRHWQDQMLLLLAVWLPATLLLALLASIAWRQQAALRLGFRQLEQRVAERTAALAASEAEFRATFDSSVIGKVQCLPDSLRIVRVNQRFCDITGYGAEALTGGMSWPDLICAENRARELDRFHADLNEQGTSHVEMRWRHAEGHAIWVEVGTALIRDEEGRPLRTVSAVQDITERKLAEQRQALLAREVDHRAKNALAVVQAALRLTPKADAEAYARAIEGRVAALARAQTLLARAHWRGAELRRLVEGELAAFLVQGEAGPRVRVMGVPVSIPAELTQPLSMALHELATNATKHGALSVPDGRLEVSWQLDGEVLRLVWRERGGPAVEGPPGRAGFGSRLLRTTVSQQLGGVLDQRWEPAGLVCVLELPLRVGMARRLAG